MDVLTSEDAVGVLASEDNMDALTGEDNMDVLREHAYKVVGALAYDVRCRGCVNQLDAICELQEEYGLDLPALTDEVKDTIYYEGRYMRDEWTEAGGPYNQCSMQDLRATDVSVEAFRDPVESIRDFGNLFREYCAMHPHLTPPDDRDEDDPSHYDPNGDISWLIGYQDVDWLVDQYYKLKQPARQH